MKGVICFWCKQETDSSLHGSCEHCKCFPPLGQEHHRTAMKALEDLTVGGSEFSQNPDNCYRYLLAERESHQRLIKSQVGELQRLRGLLEVLTGE